MDACLPGRTQTGALLAGPVRLKKYTLRKYKHSHINLKQVITETLCCVFCAQFETIPPHPVPPAHHIFSFVKSATFVEREEHRSCVYLRIGKYSQIELHTFGLAKHIGLVASVAQE